MKSGNDSILSVVHETAKGLRGARIMNEITMREFDALCLSPVKFAAYLNVSKTSVASWESGGKKPGPTAAKLLNLVDRKGIQAVA